MSIVFCNVGWMERYDGIDGDSIKRGGSYNDDSVGHEVCNFSNIGERVYGYVQPTGRIKIEKLGAKKSEECAKGVTVIWTAGPKSGGTAVVGWYKNATVYRDPQRISKPTKLQQKNGLDTFRISAFTSDTRLLAVGGRGFMIPRAVKGGIGQSNVWYADKPESAALVKNVLRYIERDTEDELLPDVDANASGFEGNPRFVAHLQRERNNTIVNKKRIQTLAATGALCCEVCDFDFEKIYGELGKEFCEVHHLIALHKSDGIVETKLSDLAIVCSNCHRILHRTSPMSSINKLQKLIQEHGA